MRRALFCAFMFLAVALVAKSDAREANAPAVTFAKKLIEGGKFTRVATTPAPGGGTAYLRTTIIFQQTEAPDTVMQTLTDDAFFDEALTLHVLNYQSTGPCKVLGPSATITGGYEVNCTNNKSMLTVFVTDEGLLQGLGLDDCNLTVNVARDVSDGCARPTFQVSACVDMDVFAIYGEKFQWGDQSQDRCVKRATLLEPETFDRVVDANLKVGETNKDVTSGSSTVVLGLAAVAACVAYIC